MNRSKADRNFFSILKEKDSTLASYVEKVRERGLDDWVHLLQPELGSHAGYPHLRNVERIAGRIIPDHLKDDFSGGEIFLLLSAIFLHDIGKTIQSPPPGEAWCNLEPKDCTIPDKDKRPRCYKAYWDHFKLGEEIIERQGIALGLPDERIAQYCGLLVFCHGLREPPLKAQPVFIDEKSNQECQGKWPERGDYRTTSLAPYGVLRIPLLASILRIADETDDSWTRALRDYWFNLQKHNPDKVGKAFRRCIEDIEFCHEGQCLILHIPEMDDVKDDPDLCEAYIQSINKVRADITTVLKLWGKELTKIGVQFEDAYIEYHNHLHKDFHPGPDQPLPLLGDVVDDKKRESIQQMLDGSNELSGFKAS